MAKSVENRVVSITFDNKQFENNIASTLKSLDTLRKYLNSFEGTVGVIEFNNAVGNFNSTPMEQGIESISNKISAMGAIGFTVIQRLTNGFLNMAQSLGSRIWDPIIGGGSQRALNIEQAKFMFKGLGINIEQGMKSALDAVLGTAYGLDEAAKAASQFAASGIEVGTAMTTALRGVAGAAAMTGSTFSDISQIYVGIAATGKLTNQDLMQFGTRGLNVAAALGKQWGITEQQVHEMATEGQIDFKTFANAMDDAFGEHATKANETFRGALANLRAAMSRLGASFLGTPFEHLRDVFNALSPVIDKFTKVITPAKDIFVEMSRITFGSAVNDLNKLDLTHIGEAINHLAKGIWNLFAAFVAIFGPAKKAFAAVFPSKEGSAIAQFGNLFELLTFKIYKFIASGDRLFLTFRTIFSVISIVWTVFKGVVSIGVSVFNVFKALLGAIGFFGKGAGKTSISILDLIYKLQQFLVQGERIQGFFKVITDAINWFARGVNTVVQWLMPIFGKFWQVLVKVVEGIWTVFSKVIIVVKELWDRFKPIDKLIIVFKKLGNAISGFFKGLFGGSKETKKSVGQTTSYFQQLTAAFQKFWDLFSKAGNISEILSSFKQLGNAIGEIFGIEELGGKLDRFKDKIIGFFKGLSDNSVVKAVIDQFKNVKDAIGGLFKDDEVSTAIGTGKKTKGALDSVGGGITNVWNKLTSLFDQSANFKKIWQGTSDNLKKVDDLVKSIGKTVGHIFDSLVTGIRKGLSKENLEYVKGIFQWLFAFGALKAIMDFSKAMKNFSKEGVRFRASIDGLEDALKTWQNALRAEMIKDIAIALLMLAAAVFVLASINKDRLNPALIAIGVLAGILLTFMIMINSMSKDVADNKVESGEKGQKNAKRFMALATSLVLISVAMLILAEAVRRLGTMDEKQLGLGIGTIVGFLALLFVAMRFLPPEKDVQNLGLGILAIAVAMLVLQEAVERMAQLRVQEIIRGMLPFIAFIGMFFLAGRFLPPEKDMLRFGLAIAAVSGAMFIIGEAIRRVAEIKDPKKMESATYSLIGVMVAIGGFLLIYSKMQEGKWSFEQTGDELLKFAGAVGIIALAMGVIALAVSQIANIKDYKKMITAMTGLMILFVVIAGALLMFDKAQKKKATWEKDSNQLLKFAAAVGIIAFAMGIIAMAVTQMATVKDFKKMITAILGLVILFVAIAGALIMFDKAQSKRTYFQEKSNEIFKFAAAIVIIAFAMGMIAGAIQVMASVEDLAKLQAAIIGLTSIFLAIAAIFIIMDKIGYPKESEILSFAGAIGIVSIAMVAIATAVRIMQKVSPKKMAIALGGFAIILGIFGLIMVGLSALAKPDTGIMALQIAGAIGIVSVAFAAFAAAVLMLADVPIMSIVTGITAFVIFIGLFVGLVAALSFLGPLAPIIVEFAQSVAFVLVTLAAAFTLFAAGVWLISDAFVKLSEIDPQGLQNIINFLDALIPRFPMVGISMGQGLAMGIGAFFQALTPQVETARPAFNQMILFAFSLLQYALDTMATYIGPITQSIVNIFLKFMEVLNAPENMVNIVGAVFEFILKLLSLMAQALLFFMPVLNKIAAAFTAAFLASLIPGKAGDVIEKKFRKDIGNIFKNAGNLVDEFKASLGFGEEELSPEISKYGGGGKSGSWGMGEKPKMPTPEGPNKEESSNKMNEYMKWLQEQLNKATGGMQPPAMPPIQQPAMPNMNEMTQNIQQQMQQFQGQLGPSMQGINAPNINPTITPVLDLSQVKKDSGQIPGMLGNQKLMAGTSFDQANSISAMQARSAEEPPPAEPATKEVKFEQNIYAPEQLSTADIYRQTRSQVALAKEKLNV